MNNFYKAVDYIKYSFEADEAVHTIVYATEVDSHYFKKNLYPLVFITPSSTDFLGDGTNNFTFEVGVFGQVSTKEIFGVSKFLSNDDRLDIHNTCYLILTNFITKVNNDLEFYIENIGSFTPSVVPNFNGLEGFVITFDLKAVNNT